MPSQLSTGMLQRLLVLLHVLFSVIFRKLLIIVRVAEIKL